MVIDISNTETYPVELEVSILKYIDGLSQTTKDIIKQEKIEYSSDVRCAIENYLCPSRAESFYAQLIDIMEKYNLICYHSTKVLDINSILDKGLHPNEWKWYSQTLIDAFRNLDINEVDLIKAMDLVKHEYERKYIEREPALCFFSDLSLIEEDGTAGYEQFCENIGGELARWALKKKEPSIYNLLKAKGRQIIVKFEISFSDVVWFQKEDIVYQFVCYVAAKYFWNYKYQIQFDGITRNEIKPNKIIELIPYDKEIDY